MSQDFTDQRQDVLQELDGVNGWEDDGTGIEETVDESNDMTLATLWNEDGTEHISIYSSINTLNKWEAYYEDEDGQSEFSGQMSPQAVINWVRDTMENKR